MSTMSNSQPTLNSKAKTAAPTQQFIPLSQLAHQQATVKDLTALLPAAIISLVLNTALVIGLLWSNAGRVSAGDIQTVTTEHNDETSFDNKDMIDLEGDPTALGEDSDPLSPIDVNIPAPAAMLPNPEDPKKTEAGSQGENKGFVGNDDPGGALIGTYLGPDVKPGFIGEGGAGPLGEGGGLGGFGGGTNAPGGVGDREAGRRAAGRYGANNESEKAVALGLVWLGKHQAPDGRWSLDKYHQHAAGCNCKGPDEKAGANDTAGTALALLPFLGAGQTHKKGTFQRHIHAGLRFLISKQNTQGDLGGGMYSHGIATITLCEAYAMTKDPILRDAAQKAINFIVNAQNKTNGGWRYTARSDTSDTSVVGWQVMALRSGQMAGLNVSAQTLQGAKRWLDSCAKDGGSKYSYTPESGATPTMTATGLLNRQYLGWGPRNPDLHKGCQYMLTNLPPAKANNTTALGPIYYYYYAAQVMHHMGGDYWNKWNPLCRDFLIATQQKDGHKAGSWNPEGSDWGGPGGRIYTTSLAILTLEVYYRYLPLYRREVRGEEPASP